MGRGVLGKIVVNLFFFFFKIPLSPCAIKQSNWINNSLFWCRAHQPSQVFTSNLPTETECVCQNMQVICFLFLSFLLCKSVNCHYVLLISLFWTLWGLSSFHNLIALEHWQLKARPCSLADRAEQPVLRGPLAACQLPHPEFIIYPSFWILKAFVVFSH